MENLQAQNIGQQDTLVEKLVQVNRVAKTVKQMLNILKEGNRFHPLSNTAEHCSDF